MIKCPLCSGYRKLIPIFIKLRDGLTEEEKSDALEKLKDKQDTFFDCRLCSGTGEVSDEVLARYQRGQEFKKKRIASGYGLREYAEAVSLRPSWVAEMENGRWEPIEFIEPPSRDVWNAMRQYAHNNEIISAFRVYDNYFVPLRDAALNAFNVPQYVLNGSYSERDAAV